MSFLTKQFQFESHSVRTKAGHAVYSAQCTVYREEDKERGQGMVQGRNIVRDKLNGFDHSLNLAFSISPISSTNMIYDVEDDPISPISPISYINMIHDVEDDPIPPSLQSGTINILQVPPSPFSVKSAISMIYDVKDDPILQVSNQELSTSSKSPTYPLSTRSCLIFIKLTG